MAKCSLIPIHQSSGQGSNSLSLSPTRNSEVGYSSPPRRQHESSYQHLHFVHPITCQFSKTVELTPGVQDLPYASKKPKTTPKGVVSSVEEVVLAMLEGLPEAIENEEEPPVFRQGEHDTLVILGSDTGTRSRREGNGGGGGRDEPTD